MNAFDAKTDREILQEIRDITLEAKTIHGRLAMRDRIKALLEARGTISNCGTPGCEGWNPDNQPTESETET